MGRSSAVVVSLAASRYTFGFGDLLIKIRATHGWSQADLARHAGITVELVDRYETGTEPTLSDFMGLCRALNLNLWSAYAELQPHQRPAKCELLPFRKAQERKHG